MAEALGWPMEVVIPTGIPKGNGYPTCYKVDVGSKDLKIAIEIDGNSHKTLVRQSQDRKKEEFLASIGWTVLRFTNQEVDENLKGCVEVVMSTISKLRGITTTSRMAS